MFSVYKFQSPASVIMEGIIDLHSYVFFYLVLIFGFVFTIFTFIIYYFYVEFYYLSENQEEFEEQLLYRGDVLTFRSIAHGSFLEIVWTTIPSVILAIIAVPSFALLYAMDEVVDPESTVKVIGRQWYWIYEYSDWINMEDVSLFNSVIRFESYMVPESALEIGDFRLLTATTKLILPAETDIRVIVTASDVLHSWAVPAFGVKVDAVPGRLNQVPLYVNWPGQYYGQCSELCGVYHGFMPTVIKVIPKNWFMGLIEDCEFIAEYFLTDTYYFEI